MSVLISHSLVWSTSVSVLVIDPGFQASEGWMFSDREKHVFLLLPSHCYRHLPTVYIADCWISKWFWITLFPGYSDNTLIQWQYTQESWQRKWEKFSWLILVLCCMWICTCKSILDGEIFIYSAVIPDYVSGCRERNWSQGTITTKQSC